MQFKKLYDAEKAVEKQFSKKRKLALFESVSDMHQEQTRALVRMQACGRTSKALDTACASVQEYGRYTRSRGYKASYMGAQGMKNMAATKEEAEKKMEDALENEALSLVKLLEAADSSGGQ